MGLDINTSILLREWTRTHGITGPVLTLGVQQVDFTWRQFFAATGVAEPRHEPNGIPRAPELLRACNIGETFSLDVSGHEGPDFLFDLNCDAPPPHLALRFGAVLNGGTIEHVFNLPHALTAITRMLRPGGIVIHIVPVHNWVDHGFYQISPTLLFDYYSEARFDILEAAALAFPASNEGACEVMPAPPGALGAGGRSVLGDRAVLCMFAARKTDTSLDTVTPTQSFYRGEPFHPPPSLRWFAPYSTTRGMRSAAGSQRVVLGSFSRQEGLAWHAPLPSSSSEGDTLDAPGRSRLTLLEDNRLLGPAHATHEIIRQHGGGSYSHWHEAVLFSTSDGSDPNYNGRTYIAVFPQN